ncbi:hypothetical protein [Methylobacterium soli]|uniref:Uncharacterized protein n=1 Tax=Methylobacterium soli TaxID=553447 RepID=A0A6L3SS99_9HYPH|nr:hypothetical protein [Methylobacterium soli]KAB1071015.1 hypothetical protein F6X53_29475 [Methylobacterium soli]GJE42379.1 hypothetical protein AEGHOMDF_1551 [Methylobacterium soli]
MRHVSALVLLFVALSPATADDGLAGKEMLTSPHGQPLCDDEATLREYLSAMLKKDQEAMEQIDGCAMLRPGLRVAVLEDVASSGKLAHVVRIRAFGHDSSVVGYTLSFGLQPR